jgi:HAD superfamily hydrolase (TIGR01549 family)
VNVRAVFFDVGEVLVDESRLWALWAHWLAVPPPAFFAALGDVIARGEHHRRVFDLVRPDLAPFDVDAARTARAAAGYPEDLFGAEDLYPDAVPCLATLRTRGLRVGLAGNQPARSEAVLRALGVPADVVASSERWGVAKPSAAFFARVVEAAGVPASAVAYVGDRVDNDVVPAADAGLVAVLLRRGPWGVRHTARPEAARARLQLDTLAALPDALAALGECQDGRKAGR